MSAERREPPLEQMAAVAAQTGWNGLWRDVAGELAFQAATWGGQTGSTPEQWWLIVSEEFGEAAQAIREGRWPQAQAEIVQTIACLVRLHARLAQSAAAGGR